MFIFPRLSDGIEVVSVEVFKHKGVGLNRCFLMCYCSGQAEINKSGNLAYWCRVPASSIWRTE